MSAFVKWQELAQGNDCPFDHPRADSSEHWDKISTLSVSTLYLHRIQTYRGYSVLVFDPRHVTALDQLEREERASLMADLSRAQGVLRTVVKPDHFNIECLGNAIPHLHWHIIPRYRNDGRWGLPIWMTREEELPRINLPQAERDELLRQLKEAFAA